MAAEEDPWAPIGSGTVPFLFGSSPGMHDFVAHHAGKKSDI